MKSTANDYLVLWTFAEAHRVQGWNGGKAVGRHANRLNRGDRMFVTATHGGELYLLGVITVARSGNNWSEGKSLSGGFQLIPLRGLKWRLRFENTSAVKLSKKTALAFQVRARRRLSSQSATLLEQALISDRKRVQTKIRVQEGKTRQVTLDKRERSSTLRVAALADRGTSCEICGFDFAETYGEFAKNCVEVHHIEALAGAGKRGVTNSLDDVLVVCPNCHRALHQFNNPSKWKAFQKACSLG